MLKETIALILAAGKGTRMRSETPKVLYGILGKPMICHVLDSVKNSGVDEIIVIAGHESGLVKEELRNAGVGILVQKALLGSGDAVNTAKKALVGSAKNCLVLCGDTPLIRAATLKDIIAKHKKANASATVLTVKLKNPSGYGRIARDADDRITKIIEDNEASFYEEVINEINVGAYCFNVKDLFDALAEVKSENKKKEYYLTDVISILHKKRKMIADVTIDDEEEAIGVNTRLDLAKAHRTLKERIINDIMESGVTVQDPASTTIYPDVKIGADTIIYPNTIIESDCQIGSRCRIGPFARIRNGVFAGDDVEIGNFVELVRTNIGVGTKVKHHTYLGDAIVGRFVNIGAGTITANFDGKTKNKTIIGDGSFIGIGARLVAPVKIGKGAVVGAGSVVLKGRNVPDGATVAGVPARILRNKVTSQKSQVKSYESLRDGG